jgi:hypothetical protein
MPRPVRRARHHGGRDGRDRGPIRKQREVNNARRADGSLTGVGKAPEKAIEGILRKVNIDYFGFQAKFPYVGQPAPHPLALNIIEPLSCEYLLIDDTSPTGTPEADSDRAVNSDDCAC